LHFRSVGGRGFFVNFLSHKSDGGLLEHVFAGPEELGVVVQLVPLTLSFVV